MAPGFSFPPPPPPPPKSSQQPYGSSRGGYDDGGRGRGRGRGRGMPGGGRGGLSDDYARSTTNQYPAGSYVNPHFRPDTQLQRNTDPRDGRNSDSGNHGQKRKRQGNDGMPTGSWRGNHTPSAGSRPHPMKQTQKRAAVPPAVPSFGAPFSFTRPGQSPAVPSSISGASSSRVGGNHGSTSTHGLPAPFAHDSSESESEDDADEEEAFRDTVGESLKFEHDGEIIVLETLADLKAWQDERRSKFPTNRRIEQRDVERQARMDERRRIEMETAAFFGYPTRFGRGVAGMGRTDGQPTTGTGDDGPSSSRAEQPNTNIHKADMNTGNDEDTTHTTTQPPSLGLAGYASSSSSCSRRPSLSPSSDSSPDIQSSKTLPQRICRNFSAPGGCRFGVRCTFSHVGEPGRPLPPPPRPREKRDVTRQGKEKKGNERKTLYQRLVEQEQLAENKLALMAVRYLGEKGFFRDTAP